MRSNLIKSFINAVSGIKYFFRNERNGKLQLIIAFLVFIIGLILSVSMIEWLIIILFTAIVISMEMLNSALEKICDKISPELDPQIKIIKDMAAGAVLWCSIISSAAGMIIFVPKIIELI